MYIINFIRFTDNNIMMRKTQSGFSLEFCEDIYTGGCDLRGPINHIQASMPHLLKNQRDLLPEGL